MISLVFVPSAPAQALTTSTLNFQARLQTASGAIVPDGTYNIEFKLYNASSSSGSSQGSCTGDPSCLWTETRTNANQVTVKNGYLTVNLGSVTSFPATINWDQQLWLTMRVGGTGASPTWDGEMSPRLQLTGAAYAFRAGQLAQYNSTTGYTSSLSLANPTGGNQTFQIADQGAAGTYTLLTTTQANANYIQNTTTPQAANFNITGNGTVGGNLSVGGNTTLKTASNSAAAFQVQNAAGLTAINVDTTTNNLTLGMGKLILNGLAAVAPPTISLTTSGGTLPNSTTYYYRVAAYNGAGHSPAIDSSPLTLTTSNATSRITVSWTAVSGATGYYVYRSNDGGNTYYRNDVGNVTSISDNGSAYTWSGTDYTTDNRYNTTSNIDLATGGTLDFGNGGEIWQSASDSSFRVGNYASGGTLYLEGDSLVFRDTTGYNTDFRISNNGAILAQNRADSTTAFQIQDAGGTYVTNVDTTDHTLTVRSGGDTAALSAEMAPTNFTTSWTGSGWTFASTSATHTAGSTTPLQPTPALSVVAGGIYQVVFTVSGSTAGTVTASAGGSTNGVPVPGNSSNETQILTANNTGNLLFTPSSSFNGTISAVSLKLLTISNPTVSLQNADGTPGINLRAGGSGMFNTFVGESNGGTVISGIRNTGLGSAALGSITTGGNNTAVGNASLNLNTTGAYNTAVGTNSMNINTTGNSNTAVGYNSLYNNVTGNYNAALGLASMQASTAGSYNAALGYYALSNSTTGNSNTAIGYSTLNQTTTGSYNTAIGYQAGDSDPDGFTSAPTTQNSTAIGAYAQINTSNSLVLGGAGSQQVKVGIATGNPLNPLSVMPIQYGDGCGAGCGNGTTVSASGTTTVTGNGGVSWTSSMVGNIIVVNGQGSFRVVSVPTATTMTINTAATFTNANYRIHYAGLQVASNGTIGIGTVSPNYNLDIQSNGYTASRVQSTSSGSLTEMRVESDSHSFSLGTGGSGTSDANSLYIYDNTANGYRLSIGSTGNVGIGGMSGANATTTLDVNGLIRVRNPQGETAAPTRGNNGEFAFANVSGFGRLYFRANGTNYYINNSGTGDYSEYFLKQDQNQTLKTGSLVSLDSGKAAKATGGSQSLGVVSAFGTRNNDDTTGDGDRGSDPRYVNVGLLGQLPVIVSSENGAIAAGTPIAPSSTVSGAGMAAAATSQIVGRATQAYDFAAASCQPIASLDDATWPADVENTAPGTTCFKLPSGVMVAKIMAYVNPAQYVLSPAADLTAQLSDLQSQFNGLGASVNTGSLSAVTLTVTGNASIQGDLSVGGVARLGGLEISGHIVSKGEAPAVSMLDGLGSASDASGSRQAKVSVAGNDTAGIISITAGDDPKGRQVLSLKFNKPFAGTPQIMLTPVGYDSASLPAYVDSPAPTGFILGVTAPPRPGQTYQYSYYVIQ